MYRGGTFDGTDAILVFETGVVAVDLGVPTSVSNLEVDIMVVFLRSLRSIYCLVTLNTARTRMLRTAAPVSTNEEAKIV